MPSKDLDYDNEENICNASDESEKQSLFKPQYNYESAIKIRKILAANNSGCNNLEDKYFIEWIIGAAIDNGWFSPWELKGMILSSNVQNDLINSSLEQVLELGIFKTSKSSFNDLPVIDLVYLSDIDDIVIQQLNQKFSLNQATTSLRSALKDLAQSKALRDMWQVKPDVGFFIQPKEPQEGLESDTIKVIEETINLKVVSEYGTWMRRTPFREAIQELLDRNRTNQLSGNQSTIQAIISLPPPLDSEGYNEWCDSIQVLRDWETQIYFADNDKQNQHFTLGRKGAMSFRRERTQNRLNLTYLHHSKDLKSLQNKFDEYLSDPSTISLRNWLKTNSLVVKGSGFNILSRGLWKIDDIEVKYLNEFSAIKTEEITAFIETKWEIAKKQANESSQQLFSDDLVRLKDFCEIDNKLVLNLGNTSYKDYVGTNKNIHEFSQINKIDSLSEYLANPLSCCIVVISNDNKILIGKRSSNTFDYPKFFHVPGGHIEEAHVENISQDISVAICDELLEEFSIDDSHIEEIFLTGLVEDIITLKPELTYLARINVDSSSILKQANDEHEALVWIDASQESINKFLIDQNLQIVPVGKACLMLFGIAEFGYEWFFNVNDTMREAWGRENLELNNT